MLFFNEKFSDSIDFFFGKNRTKICYIIIQLFYCLNPDIFKIFFRLSIY